MFRRPFFWIFFALVGAGVIFFLKEDKISLEDETKAQVASITDSNIPPVDALIVQEDADVSTRRILQCGANGCLPQKAPKSIGGDALFDGENWYRYVDTEKDGTAHVVLEKVDFAGNTRTITEENPLVRPRGMMVSVDGGKLAYFLDNISDDKNLTELWVYDSLEGGTRVVAEKLSKKDIASSMRWSASSQVAWFLQDGEGKQLMAVSMNGVSSPAMFAGIDWEEHSEAADHGIMDINDDAKLVAFAESSYPAFSKLYVARENGPAIQKSIKGQVVFLRWMKDDALLYAVQDGKDVAFWIANAEKEWPITRMAANFESARSVGGSGEEAVAFIASPRNGEKHLYVLDVASGNIKDEAIIPQFSGKTHLVQVRERGGAGAVLGSSSALSDSVLVAFIEDHIPGISGESRPQPARILITDTPNTCFVDYLDDAGQEQRIQVAIIDAVHPEWRILGRYKVVNGIWASAEGGPVNEPKAIRLYEWEDILSQWILKKQFKN